MPAWPSGESQLPAGASSPRSLCCARCLCRRPPALQRPGAAVCVQAGTLLPGGLVRPKLQGWGLGGSLMGLLCVDTGRFGLLPQTRLCALQSRGLVCRGPPLPVFTPGQTQQPSSQPPLHLAPELNQERTLTRTWGETRACTHIQRRRSGRPPIL